FESGGQVYVRDIAKGETTLVSVNANGEPGNGVSSLPQLSADGQFVAFQSNSSNLDVARPDANNGGPNGCACDSVLASANCSDVFVRDRGGNTTTLVSLVNDGGSLHQPSATNAVRPSISADGRFVAFHAQHFLLDVFQAVPQLDMRADVYVHDRNLHETIPAIDFAPGDTSGTFAARLSPDGRFVALTSFSNLIPGVPVFSTTV